MQLPSTSSVLTCFVATATTLVTAPASAQTLVSEDESAPFPGIRLLERNTRNPSWRIKVSFIDLCTDHVEVLATAPPSSRRTAASWARSVGAQLAVNGDFYRTDRSSPTVYGNAVGGSRAWPSIQTGVDERWSEEWYFRDYGWIAFGTDWVDFTHSGFVKRNSDRFGVTQGFSPTRRTHEIPAGTRALVSGFPELVIEGEPVTCSSPTADDCFRDRSDMRARHPRTAMGLTEDRRTFILAVVDGRSSSSVGMYGTELAALMHELGAFVAFNLDGGGSSQMWLQGRGTVNRPSDGSARSVANHWGVKAGADSGTREEARSCFTWGGCYPTDVAGADDATFADLPPDWVGAEEAEILLRAGITSGCASEPRAYFCPRCRITRAQFLAFIVRAAGLDTSNPPATPSFSDVDTDHSLYAVIEAAAAAGITSGCGDGRFCPNRRVTRAQAASLIVRAIGWPALNPETPSFEDVPRDHTHYRNVETLVDRCVTGGCREGDFCPGRRLTRAEAAVFVARAWDLEEANPCRPEPTPMPEPTPTPTSAQTPEPEPTPEPEQTPAPEPTPTPTMTPEPEPTPPRTPAPEVSTPAPIPSTPPSATANPTGQRRAGGGCHSATPDAPALTWLLLPLLARRRARGRSALVAS